MPTARLRAEMTPSIPALNRRSFLLILSFGNSFSASLPACLLKKTFFIPFSFAILAFSKLAKPPSAAMLMGASPKRSMCRSSAFGNRLVSEGLPRSMTQSRTRLLFPTVKQTLCPNSVSLFFLTIMSVCVCARIKLHFKFTSACGDNCVVPHRKYAMVA